jgi:hypothetical protein
VASDLGAHEAGGEPREQEAAQDGCERRRGDLDPDRGCDGFRRRVGLLSGQPALFDREVRQVAGGEDVLDVADPPVLVDRDEAIRVVRDPRQAGAFDTRERDDAIRFDVPRSYELEHAFLYGEWNRVGSEADSVSFEQLPGGVAGGGAKQLERTQFWSDELKLDVRPGVGEVHRREEGELVQR